jgi:hypothetical protein
MKGLMERGAITDQADHILDGRGPCQIEKMLSNTLDDRKKAEIRGKKEETELTGPP